LGILQKGQPRPGKEKSPRHPLPSLLIRPTPACTATPSSTSGLGEDAAGHLPGARNIPLVHLHTAVSALKTVWQGWAGSVQSWSRRNSSDPPRSPAPCPSAGRPV